MKALFILLGFISMILGLIGIIVPGLPTTPFLLLALYCFGKSSERLTQWFLSTTIYSKYLKSFDQTRAMTLKQKISILAFSVPFCIFAFFVIPHIIGKLILIAVIIFQYYYFIFKIKTLEK
ncbi:YbaN family protein [Glaesserella parasuis]|uniref:YbaN family protein n=1 Tax=Glaesserella parasuis TaxID=738 RepID=UPI002722BFEA|nr:YbaN family protein [Glaesserella parasuis]MDP0061815.1 YbaN family protein [Glaesserella parasuis]